MPLPGKQKQQQQQKKENNPCKFCACLELSVHEYSGHVVSFFKLTNPPEWFRHCKTQRLSTSGRSAEQGLKDSIEQHLKICKG